jgi:hypothetical protein
MDASEQGTLNCGCDPYRTTLHESQHFEALRQLDAAAIKVKELRGALHCWPLKSLLQLIEVSGDEAMQRMANLFIEVKDDALKF